MSGKDSNFKAVIVVVIIAAVCAALLAFVKESTADKIAEAKRKETLDALQKVVPQGCTISLEQRLIFPEGANENDGNARLVFPGFDDAGTLCGIAVRTRTDKGYSGKILVVSGFVGLDAPEGLRLQRIYVTEHAETPGLGSLITNLQDEEPGSWGDDRGKVLGVNFREKPVSALSFVVKKGADAGENDVVAMTAATISSRAVTEAVSTAAELLKAELPRLTAAFSAPAGGSEQ